MDAVYRLEGARAICSPLAKGPWGPSQHGSAPASLIAHLAETYPSTQPMRIARLTIDLMRPVPLAPLDIRVEIVRDGRKIRLLRIELSVDSVTCVSATVLQIRRAPVALPREAAREEPVILPGPDADPRPSLPLGRSPFLECINMKFVKGAFNEVGPAAAWFRVERPIIEGVATSRVMRVAVAADFCNGTSALLPFKDWTFINGDLTISLARDPVDDWILLDSRTRLGPDGAGLAFAELADRQGYFGRAVQSLVVEPRNS